MGGRARMECGRRSKLELFCRVVGVIHDFHARTHARTMGSFCEQTRIFVLRPTSNHSQPPRDVVGMARSWPPPVDRPTETGERPARDWPQNRATPGSSKHLCGMPSGEFQHPLGCSDHHSTHFGSDNLNSSLSQTCPSRKLPLKPDVDMRGLANDLFWSHAIAGITSSCTPPNEFPTQ